MLGYAFAVHLGGLFDEETGLGETLLGDEPARGFGQLPEKERRQEHGQADDQLQGPPVAVVVSHQTQGGRTQTEDNRVEETDDGSVFLTD